MSSINDMMKRLERLDVMQTAADSMEDTRQDFIRHQKEQLYAGRNADDKEVTPFYRPATIAIKKKKGQPTDRVTLKDSGSFYDGVFMDVRKETFVVSSADSKTGFLVKKYNAVFGLAGDFKVEYVRDLRPVFNKKIEDITGLKFGG